MQAFEEKQPGAYEKNICVTIVILDSGQTAGPAIDPFLLTRRQRAVM